MEINIILQIISYIYIYTYWIILYIYSVSHRSLVSEGPWLQTLLEPDVRGAWQLTLKDLVININEVILMINDH